MSRVFSRLQSLGGTITQVTPSSRVLGARVGEQLLGERLDDVAPGGNHGPGARIGHLQQLHHQRLERRLQPLQEFRVKDGVRPSLERDFM